MYSNKPDKLIVHHTGGTDANLLADTSHHTFKIVDDFHRAKGWGKIGYHYFIEKSGKLTQGRADNEEGAHTIGQNRTSLGVCRAGNFDAPLPTPEQVDTLRKLLKEKCAQYSIPAAQIFPHRHFSSKSCYGKNLTHDWARALVEGEPKNDDEEVKKL